MLSVSGFASLTAATSGIPLNILVRSTPRGNDSGPTITAKVKKPLGSEDAAEILGALSAWKTHAPEMRDVLRAIEIQRRYQISFWDAMIIASAAKLNCDILWSEDLNDEQVYDGVKVKNPFS